MVSVGWILIMVFVVGPAIGWRVWGNPNRRGRFRGRRSYGVWGDFDDQDAVSGREVAQLREELDSRMGDIDSLHARVAELENRLDFTERLLARGQQPLEAETPDPNR